MNKAASRASPVDLISSLLFANWLLFLFGLEIRCTEKRHGLSQPELALLTSLCAFQLSKLPF